MLVVGEVEQVDVTCARVFSDSNREDGVSLTLLSKAITVEVEGQSFVLLLDFIEGTDCNGEGDAGHVQILVLVFDVVGDAFGVLFIRIIVESAPYGPHQTFLVLVLDIDAGVGVRDRFGEFDP